MNYFLHQVMVMAVQKLLKTVKELTKTVKYTLPYFYVLVPRPKCLLVPSLISTHLRCGQFHCSCIQHSFM